MNKGRTIRKERRKYDITQSELAKAIGHKGANAYISDVERGKFDPSETQYNKMMDAILKLAQDKAIK